MLKILLAEDERAICDFVSRGLESAGYACEVARDGNAAAELLARAAYDLALLDVMLPGIDGFELMRYIAPLSIPVIFLTARAAVDDRVKGCAWARMIT